MGNSKVKEINSPMGKQAVDADGSPIGAVRMDPEKSYAGIGELLGDYINNTNQKAWDKIKLKIDYTLENLNHALNPLSEKTNLRSEIKSRLEMGQKLLFKPNLVSPTNIDPQTHGADEPGVQPLCQI